MDEVARRRMLQEAAVGIEALEAWLDDLVGRADLEEMAGEMSLAQSMRECAAGIRPLVTGTLPELIRQELHEAESLAELLPEPLVM